MCRYRWSGEQIVPENAGPVVGIDLGIKTLATLSDGEGDCQPAPPRTASQEAQAPPAGGEPEEERQPQPEEGGARAGQAASTDLRNQRRNTLHQVTTRLAKTKSVLVIEDLHVSGMLKNHHLAQAIGDVGFAEFKRQLLYKANWYGSRVILADRWEPSSKRCSGCGWSMRI